MTMAAVTTSCSSAQVLQHDDCGSSNKVDSPSNKKEEMIMNGSDSSATTRNKTMMNGKNNAHSDAVAAMDRCQNNGGGPFTNSSTPSKHVGILGMEVYIPATYITQEDLEKHNGVAPGKYTIGLGQECMGVVAGDVEDINSICLTVTQRLLEKYNIDPSREVGRLEVGTETLVDKSKSTKTVLMQLFGSKNTDIEGATIINACYGGTAALFNAITWVESDSWDGRYAIVVCGDIAAYAAGPARPTCGCGAVAILVGRDAPLAMSDPRQRVTHASHTYDFYKPDHSVEYPTVDGALSQSCYYRALEDCYERFCSKMETLHKKEKVDVNKEKEDDFSFNVTSPDYFVFHAPYNKLVQKSFGRLYLMDEKRKLEHIRRVSGGNSDKSSERTFLEQSPVGQWIGNCCCKEDDSNDEEWEKITYSDRALDGVLKKISSSDFTKKLDDSNRTSKLVGNTYTASVFLGLASLVSSGKLKENDTLCVFSYGSGALASMYQLTIREPTSSNKRFTIQSMTNALSLEQRLKDREYINAAELDYALELRAQMHSTPNLPYVPKYPTHTHLWPGTYYLKQIDTKWRRFYERIPLEDQTRQDRLAAAASSPESLPAPFAPKEVADWAKQILNKNVAVQEGKSAKEETSSSPSPSSSPNSRTIVITGVSAGLPGLNRKAVFDDDNLNALVRGDQCIEPLSDKIKQSLVEKNVVQLKKKRNGKGVLEVEQYPVDDVTKVIQLAAQLSDTINLSNRYGVPKGLAETMDVAAQVAVAAGLEALKAARLVSGQSSNPDEWTLASEYQSDTGVVYASSFPAMDAAVGEVMKFLQSKSVTEATALSLIHALKERMMMTSLSSTLSDEDLKAFDQLNKSIAAQKNNSNNGDNDTATTMVSSSSYQFDRKFLFRVLVLGNAQLAQLTGCRGPNAQTNAACAGTTQAIAMAEDMIRMGRCTRVVVIAGDNGSGSTLLPWLGSGFMALGAASTCAQVEEAATPFDVRRSGMLLGAGGIGMILETQGSAMLRYHALQGASIVAPSPSQQQQCDLIKAKLLATYHSNSAFHGAALDRNHIAQELNKFLSSVQEEFGITKEVLVEQGVYLSHETSTHASSASSCAGNEIAALREVFGTDLLKRLLILNTKGFTGHPMGVSFEDVAAVQILLTQTVPPIVNYKCPDKYLGELNLSKGGPHKCKYALRFAAGFGSQVAFALYASRDA